jgi:hypothetical protein
MKLYNQCRFCKKASFETSSVGMVRYALRHWCCWDCGVKKWGFEDFMRKLNPWQLTQVPLFILKDDPTRLSFIKELVRFRETREVIDVL